MNFELIGWCAVVLFTLTVILPWVADLCRRGPQRRRAMREVVERKRAAKEARDERIADGLDAALAPRRFPPNNDPTDPASW